MREFDRATKHSGQRRGRGRRQIDTLTDRLADERSKKVVFLSHCLLNENVRYLGGATRPGPVEEVFERYRSGGVGVCQMPCPEQQAWGGVLKRRMAPLYGSRVARSRAGRLLLLPAVVWWSRLVYRRVARRVAAEVRDYVDAGYEVVEVVGVGASPSCGVNTTLALADAIEAMGRCDPSSLDARTVNECVVLANVRPGRGMFTDPLVRALRRRNLHIRFREHDLVAELHAFSQG